MKEKEEQKIGYIFILSLLKNSVKSQAFLRKKGERNWYIFYPRSSEECNETSIFCQSKQQKRESETERLAPVLW
jgi:hypothetical protein